MPVNTRSDRMHRLLTLFDALLGRHPGALLRLGLILLIAPLTAGSQEAGSGAAPEAGTVESAAVTLDGETLFRVRGITSFPAARRAKGISERIRDTAEDTSISAESLRIDPQDNSTRVMAGDRLIVDVVDADAAFEGVADRTLVADAIRKTVAAALVAYREARKPEVLLVNAGYALAGTLILIVVVWGIQWTHRRISAKIEEDSKRHIEWLESRSYKLFHAEQLWALLRFALRAVRLLILLAAGYLYLNSVLGLFPWTREISRRLFDFVTDPLIVIGNGVIDYLPSLFFLIILIVITRYILLWTRSLFGAVGNKSIAFAGFEPEWAGPTYRIVRVVIIAFAVVVAYPYIPGSDSDAFKGVTLFLGVLFSLGSSSVLSNVIAGYTMTYRRAFKIGDRVRIGDTLGDVMETRLLVTHLRSLKNEEIVIPNSVILNSEVTNYSSLSEEKGLILHTTVGIGYEVPWRQVEAMLMMAAKRTTGLLSNRQPYVQQKSLGDFAITYEINVYCDRPDKMMSLYSALHRNILDVFNEYGVAIMTPAYEGDPADPKLVPRDQWYAAPAVPPRSASEPES